MKTKRTPCLVVQEALPDKYPTHMHDANFWENLGRTVATFGFLEEVLAKAILAFTATKPYSDKEIEQAYPKWIDKLKKALTDPLGNLIETYEIVVKQHPDSTIANLGELIEDLTKASRVRNALCHGSWRPPNSEGASQLLFVDRKMNKFDTPVDIDFLRHTQAEALNLACAVINTVSHMGWQFPGSKLAGEPIMKNRPNNPVDGIA